MKHNEGFLHLVADAKTRVREIDLGAPTLYAVGTSPYSMALADFNGDGKVDIATTNLNSANLSFLLNNGAGGFAPASFSPQSAGALLPVSAATGDFNADGRVDLVVGASTGVSVILGQPPSPTAKLIAVSSLSRDAGTNEVVVIFTVTNAASATATNVAVTAAMIDNTITSTSVPVAMGNIPGTSTRQATLRFPASVGTEGSTVSITLGVKSDQTTLKKSAAPGRQQCTQPPQ